MKIKQELEKQICHLRDAAIDSYESDVLAFIFGKLGIEAEQSPEMVTNG